MARRVGGKVGIERDMFVVVSYRCSKESLSSDSSNLCVLPLQLP